MLSSKERLEDMPVDAREDAGIPVVNAGSANEPTVSPRKQLDSDTCDHTEVKFKRSLRRRNGIYYGVFDISSEEESEYQLPVQVCDSIPPYLLIFLQPEKLINRLMCP